MTWRWFDDVHRLHANTTPFHKEAWVSRAFDIHQYAKDLYKKDLQDQDNHDGVITHLEPDILECEVKWALESIITNKAIENLEWRLWNSSWPISNPGRWCCESVALNMPANLENSAVATGLEKVSFHSNPKERQCQRMLKLPHNCTHLTC